MLGALSSARQAKVYQGMHPKQRGDNQKMLEEAL